jgi:predicted DNA repair protein MutK
MSIGLMALLDDVAALAKAAAQSLDDIAGQTAKAGVKAAGVVIDDAAVTPRYVIGLAAKRELPIVGKIAAGSLRNKLVVLLPAALVLSYFAPWIITPLLMLGGAYLCYEGVEKLFEAVAPRHAHAHEERLGTLALNPRTIEDQKVASAIKTDFILSAEIMAIALATVSESSIVIQAVVLAFVGIAITIVVYGVVALIVKADDFGLALAENHKDMRGAIGRALVLGVPIILRLLSAVGTAAMIWVGGGIILHGLETYGLNAIERIIHDAAEAATSVLPWSTSSAGWVFMAVGSGAAGLLVGAILIPVTQFVIAPAWTNLKSLIR